MGLITRQVDNGVRLYGNPLGIRRHPVKPQSLFCSSTDEQAVDLARILHKTGHTVQLALGTVHICVRQIPRTLSVCNGKGRRYAFGNLDQRRFATTAARGERIHRIKRTQQWARKSRPP